MTTGDLNELRDRVERLRVRVHAPDRQIPTDAQELLRAEGALFRAEMAEHEARNETDQLTRLEGQLERIGNLLEDIRDARRGQNTQKPPTREEIVRFARGGIVKGPEGGEGRVLPGDQPPHGGIVVTFDPPHGPSRQEIADATIRAIGRKGRLK